MAYLRAAEAGLELGASNAAWMLQRGYGAAGPAATALAALLHPRAAGQVPGSLPCLPWHHASIVLWFWARPVTPHCRPAPGASLSDTAHCRRARFCQGMRVAHL